MRAVLLACLLAAACGTTTIRTNDASARIYVDGRLVGQGRAEITRRGVPHTATIAVDAGGGRRTVVQVGRRFTATTLVVGLVTAYVGLITMWETPEEIYVPLPDGDSAWDEAADVWMQTPAWAAKR